MGAKLSGGDEDDPIAEINIVPFVDIILVVLIIFMVTTPFIMKPSINVNLPKAGSGDSTAPSKLSVSINSNGGLFLNGKATDEAAITTFAQELAKTEPDTQAVVGADKDVPHGRVVGIIDAIKNGGIKRFAISTDRK